MKKFVDPLLWFCVVQLVVLVIFWKHSWIKLNRTAQILWGFQIFVLSSLIAVSLPITEKFLEESLTSFMNVSTKLTPPSYIFVLGGGYSQGLTKKQDLLGEESYRRVITAVALWHKYPKAKFVLSGGGTDYPERPTERLGQLMRETAILHGVAERQIIMEPRSLNTREHPIEALKLLGVTPNIPIAIVTSGWHMRRARQEFARYFLSVQCYPAISRNDPVRIYSFIPSSDALAINTEFLQEWIGMTWYKIYAITRYL